jgi:hypothetical protein
MVSFILLEVEFLFVEFEPCALWGKKRAKWHNILQAFTPGAYIEGGGLNVVPTHTHPPKRGSIRGAGQESHGCET